MQRDGQECMSVGYVCLPTPSPWPSRVFPAYFSLLCAHALIAWNKLPLNKKSGNQFFARLSKTQLKKSQPFLYYEFFCICQEYSQTCIKRSPFGNGILTTLIEVHHLKQVWKKIMWELFRKMKVGKDWNFYSTSFYLFLGQKKKLKTTWYHTQCNLLHWYGTSSQSDCLIHV